MLRRFSIFQNSPIRGIFLACNRAGAGASLPAMNPAQDPALVAELNAQVRIPLRFWLEQRRLEVARLLEQIDAELAGLTREIDGAARTCFENHQRPAAPARPAIRLRPGRKAKPEPSPACL